jgi:hypothetical protein
MMTQKELQALLNETREHRDFLATRALELAIELSKAKETIAALQASVQSLQEAHISANEDA